MIVLGAALYGAAATVIGALSVSFDYDTLEAHLLRQSEAVYRLMAGLGRDAPLEPVRGRTHAFSSRPTRSSCRPSAR